MRERIVHPRARPSCRNGDRRRRVTSDTSDAGAQPPGGGRQEGDYVNADIFDWRPDRRYDAVFFGFWLSHVPPRAFDDFWALVRSSLHAGGRVAFVDEDDRGTVNDDIRLVGNVPTARRTLRDGRRFDVVKLCWDPTELQDRLSALGWQVAVRRVGATFLYGSGT
jgi:hypothetical protein